jgi:hypothetical protein
VKRLGAGKRVPVRVPLNGATYRSTIAVYGGRYSLPARKEIRDAAKLRSGFDAFSFTHRREFVEWIASAKRAGTHSAGIPKVVAQVRAKARAASTT